MEITNNPGKVKKVTQSTLDNEEYFKYERGKEYFERLEQELIYEDKIDPKDLSYKLGLIVTLKEVLKDKHEKVLIESDFKPRRNSIKTAGDSSSSY